MATRAARCHAQFSENTLLPINQSGDKIGVKYDKKTGNVTTPPGGWVELVSLSRHILRNVLYLPHNILCLCIMYGLPLTA